MRKLRGTCNRLVSCLEWPCPSKWHTLHNHKIASLSKRQLWAWISVIRLYSLYFYYFLTWTIYRLRSNVGFIFIYHLAFFFFLLVCLCYFEVRSFYNPLGFFFLIFSAQSVLFSFCFIFFHMCTWIHFQFSAYLRAGYRTRVGTTVDQDCVKTIVISWGAIDSHLSWCLSSKVKVEIQIPFHRKFLNSYYF